MAMSWHRVVHVLSLQCTPIFAFIAFHLLYLSIRLVNAVSRSNFETFAGDQVVLAQTLLAAPAGNSRPQFRSYLQGPGIFHMRNLGY